MTDEKGVDELLDLEIGGCNVLDNGGEVVDAGFRVGQLPEVSIDCARAVVPSNIPQSLFASLPKLRCLFDCQGVVLVEPETNVVSTCGRRWPLEQLRE